MPVHLTCSTCGTGYAAKTSKASTSRFCSRPCQQRAKGFSLTIDCATCGQSFSVSQSQYRQGWRSCSRACKAAARTRACDHCGQAYQGQRAAIQSGASRYCSRACKNAALTLPFPGYIWAKIDRSGGPDACWPWTGGRDKDGYGVTHVGGKYAKAHRVVLGLKLGYDIPDDMMACHDCPGGTDHPWCCNPSHLWEGTALQNRLDAAQKQRARERHLS